jgi:CheY-like chemotaxis protein
VITDIQMPEMDGYKVGEVMIMIEKYFFKVMRNNTVESYVKSERHCPIVALTASTDETVENKALSVGISRVYEKPATAVMMENILETFYYK